MSEILGKAFLQNESERWKIDNGNALMIFIVRLAQTCLSMRCPFAFGNPELSYLWFTDEMIQLASNKHVRAARADFCLDGTPWKKPTTFLCGFCDVATIDAACHGRCCKRSGKKHVLLQGVDPSSGKFWTAVAEPYPRPLCTRLVSMLSSARMSLKRQHLGKLLQF